MKYNKPPKSIVWQYVLIQIARYLERDSDRACFFEGGESPSRKRIIESPFVARYDCQAKLTCTGVDKAPWDRFPRRNKEGFARALRQVHPGVVIDCIIKSVYFRGRCYRSPVSGPSISRPDPTCVLPPSPSFFFTANRLPRSHLSRNERLKANAKRQPLTNLRSRKRIRRTASYARMQFIET